MTFTVTYRAKDGALREERIEAADRAGCVAECRRRGIAPARIAEGGGRDGARPSRERRVRDNAPYHAANGQDARSPSQRAGRPLSQWLVAVLIAAAAAGGAWWWLGRGEARPSQARLSRTEKPKAERRRPPHDQPASGTLAPTNAPKPKTYKDMTREEKLKSIRDKYGDNIPDNLKPTVYYLENPPQQVFHPARSKFHYLKRSSEREIASVLNIEPGRWMMRAVTFGDKFDKDLAAALGEEIKFEPDDTDEVKAVKQAVIDTKKDLAERLAKGEVASDIMNATVKELYTLGQYRRTLEEQVGTIRRNAEYTDDDVRDVVDAANAMLKEKGLPAIRMPNMHVRHASLKRAAERAAAKEAAAKEAAAKEASKKADKGTGKSQPKLGRGTK